MSTSNPSSTSGLLESKAQIDKAQIDKAQIDKAQIEPVRAALAQAVVRWAGADGGHAGGIAGLRFFQRDAPSSPQFCMVEPSVALVVQGSKRALLGDDAYTYDIGRFLITSLDLPAMMQIVEASPEQPYLGLAFRLDLPLVAEVMVQGRLTPPREAVSERGMMLGQTTVPLLDSFLRLVRLLEEPDAIPVLAPLIQREIYYRLLMSDQGMRLWHIASVGSQGYKIAQAIDWLKQHYASPLRIESLASQVQMSVSTFHHHFRLLTTKSPLQYQKWLRLNEARQLLLLNKADVATAAFQVGYESPSQFSREYSRQFGAAPRRDIEHLRSLSARVVAAVADDDG